MYGQFDFTMLSKLIYESVTFQLCHVIDLYNMQVELEKVLKEKFFLFMFHDICNRCYTLWDALKVPFESIAYGSNIIVTTQDKDVATLMGSRDISLL